MTNSASKAFHSLATIADRVDILKTGVAASFHEDPAAFIVSAVGDHNGPQVGLLSALLEDAETVSGLLGESLSNPEHTGSEFHERGVYLLGRKLQLARLIAQATHAAACEVAK